MSSSTKGISEGKDRSTVGLIRSISRGEAPVKAVPKLLRELELIDRLIHTLAGVAVFFIDIRGIIASVSPGLERMLGFSASEAVGLPAREFFLGEKKDRKKILKKLLKDSRVDRFKVVIKTKSGAGTTCRLAAAVVNDSGGGIAGVVGSLEEISHRGDRELTALVAHELKNPLSSIYLNLEMLGRRLENADDARIRDDALEIVESVIHEVEHLNFVADKYLGPRDIPRKPFYRGPFRETILELQRFMLKEMETRKVEFFNEFSDENPSVRFDKGRMKEVLMNLYANSADAMPDGGRIITRTRTHRKWFEILISDTGPGVPEAVSESLFEPFFTTRNGGAGLGLAVVDEIMKAHGGSVECRQESPEDTVFALRLPLRH